MKQLIITTLQYDDNEFKPVEVFMHATLAKGRLSITGPGERTVKAVQELAVEYPELAFALLVLSKYGTYVKRDLTGTDIEQEKAVLRESLDEEDYLRVMVRGGTAVVNQLLS